MIPLTGLATLILINYIVSLYITNTSGRIAKTIRFAAGLALILAACAIIQNY